MKLIRKLYDWVLSLAEKPTGPRALCGISFAEASFFPIPPDVLLIPLCISKRQKALYFATLLHDIGKGGGGNHNIKGSRIAKKIVLRFGESITTLLSDQM